MAYDPKVLGQAAPAATTPTDLFTASTGTVLSSITVANRDSDAATYRVSVRPGGASQANQHYVAFDVAIAGNETTVLTFGLTLAATDVVTVYGSSGDLSFSAFGVEIS